MVEHRQYNLVDHHGKINPITYFDKLALRIARAPSAVQEHHLIANANFVDVREGRSIRGSDRKLTLTIVNPNRIALEWLADRTDAHVNYVEASLDLIVSNHAVAGSLVRLFDRCFVQAWHGNHEQVRFDNGGTVTGQERPGTRFAWYADRPSKRSSDQPCFHVESRSHGVAAVRRIGIRQPTDLLTFNHNLHWQRRLRLFEINFERLGLLHRNRQTGQRRRRPAVHQSGSFTHNEDHAVGARLFHVFGLTRQGHHSVQRFVDEYGRGVYLRALDVAQLLPASGTSSLFNGGQ